VFQANTRPLSKLLRLERHLDYRATWVTLPASRSSLRPQEILSQGSASAKTERVAELLQALKLLRRHLTQVSAGGKAWAAWLPTRPKTSD